MFKSILSFSVLAAVATFVNAEAAGPGGASLEARQPYTNGEAFRRGLPPLRPRHRGCELLKAATTPQGTLPWNNSPTCLLTHLVPPPIARTWTAVKRQSSPIVSLGDRLCSSFSSVGQALTMLPSPQFTTTVSVKLKAPGSLT